MPFDRELARVLLEVCRYTYAKHIGDERSADDVEGSLAYLNQHARGLGPISLIRGGRLGTSVASVVTCDAGNVVCYMGTETEFTAPRHFAPSATDWFRNVRARLTPFRLTGVRFDCAVHDGFLSELALVQDAVVNELRRRGGKDRPLFVTGHSQGGAEAGIATLAFAGMELRPTETYTFAAPRPGDEATRSLVAAKCGPVHRIEFGNDIVPHLPPLLEHVEHRELVNRILGGRLGDDDHDWFNVHVGGLPGRVPSLVGLGALCYGDGRTSLAIDLTDADEDACFEVRRQRLRTAGKELVEHHHLRGTSEEVSRGETGNYTKLLM